MDKSKHDDDIDDDESNNSLGILKTEPSDEALSNASSDLTTEEKIQRAKELVEKKREAKEKEEEEAERLKEIERRKVISLLRVSNNIYKFYLQAGQEVQKMKRWQEDQELKEIMEQRKKELIADKEARERVLAQIAQDKAERASRFRSPNTTTIPTTASVQLKSTPSLPPDSTRIQFRLPDGTTHTHLFDNTTTVFQVIPQNV